MIGDGTIANVRRPVQVTREDRQKRATGAYKVFNNGVVVKGGVIRCHVERGDVEMVRVCLYGRAGAMVQRRKAVNGRDGNDNQN